MVRWGVMLGVLLITPAWGQMTTLEGKPVTHCTWEYPADAWERVQALYFIVAPDTSSAPYTVVQVIMPEQISTTIQGSLRLAKIACPTFALAQPGQYRLAMYALGKQGEASTYSNDVRFRWGTPSDSVPTPPPSASTPPWVWPSTPTPWAPRPTYPAPKMPKPSAGDGWLSETCMWTGTCR